MRHSKRKLQLNRFTSWNRATVISLARAMLIHQKIKTTQARAKAAKPLVEKLITLGKQNTLSAKRRAFAILQDHKLVSLLFKDIAPRFAKRAGGYTRTINLGFRRGDNAKLAILGLTEIKEKAPKKLKQESKKKDIEKMPEALDAQMQQEEGHSEVKAPKVEAATKEKPPISKKPTKKFLGGLRGIFKRERDSL
jgi:large subunit ribosomal protein L17